MDKNWEAWGIVSIFIIVMLLVSFIIITTQRETLQKKVDQITATCPKCQGRGWIVVQDNN